ncbi:hypothetical protein CVT24_007892 [Panaeolus cyanescens]|uniref:Uncharacterized protein n=1 Tax=Panaeolus cyanescens TaxID=181874 RepID=A0A409VZN0_9AGAR|nr:hypothetical protein CVT24_007892 [Panaeolus cyanescens]
MTKPTLVQSILNKPSQTYSQPYQQKKDYYSNRQEMLRIAAEVNTATTTSAPSSSSSTSLASTPQQPSSLKSPQSSLASLELQTSKPISSAMQKSKALPPQPTSTSKTQSSTTKHPSSSSPRVPVVGSAPPPHNSHPVKANSHVSSSRAHPSHKPIPLHTRQLSYTDEEEDDSSESDSDLDIFFTPNQSPRTSMASSINFPGGRKPSRRSLTSAGAELQTMKVPSSPLSALPLALAAMVEEQNKANLNASMFSDQNPPQSPSTPKVATPSRLPSPKPASAVTTSSNTTPNPTRTPKPKSTAPASSVPTNRSSNRGVATPSDSQTPSTVNPTSKSSTTVTRTYHTLSSLSISSASFDGSLLSDITQSPNTTQATTPGGNASTTEDKSKDSLLDSSPARTNGSAVRTDSSKRKLPPSESSRNDAKVGQPTNNTDPNWKGKGKEVIDHSKAKNSPTSTTRPSTNPNGTAQPSTSSPMNASSNSSNPKPSKPPHTFSAFARPGTVSGNKDDTKQEPPSSKLINKQESTSPSPSKAASPARTGKPSGSNGQANPKVPPPRDASPPKYSESDSSSPSSTPSPARRPPPGIKLAQPVPYVPPPPPSGARRKPPGPIGPIMTGIGSGMAALMEEDEDGPLTPLMERADGDWGWEGPYKTPASGKTLRHTSPRASQKMNGHARPDQVHRNGSIDSDFTHSLLSVSSSSTERSRGQSSSMSTNQSQPRTLAAEVSALKNSQMPPGTLPSKGTQGFNSLVLPRAPPSTTPKSPGMGLGAGLHVRLSAKGDGHVDLIKSGVAKTTMATVEVVRGLGAMRNGGALAKIGNVFGALGRRRTASDGRNGAIPVPVEGFLTRDTTVPRDINASSTVLGFTSYRPPPDYVPSNCVLVQVWAVGVDGVDARLVGVQFGLSTAAMYAAHEAATVLAEAEGILHAETDQFHQEPEEHERQTDMENDPQLSTSSNGTPAKKGAFSGLGRSFSLKAKMGLGRSASSKKKGGSVANGDSNGHASQNGNGVSSQHSSPSRKPGDMNRSSSTPVASQIPKRTGSFSLKRNNTTMTTASTISTGSTADSPLQGRKVPRQIIPEVGYIPGRSFVGRVLEVGWEVKDEVARKGEWVVGLLDARKCGALAEFIVVDRHRIHRVPNPQLAVVEETDPGNPVKPVWITSPTSSHGITTPATLSLEELSLLPLCGLFAYRAVRTFAVAFSSVQDGETAPTISDRRQQREDEQLLARKPYSQRITTEHSHGHRRRALVLRGHDGVGAMAVQMLVQRGWKVSVHVPFSSVPASGQQDDADRFMRIVEERARQWGADEIIFDDGEEGGSVDDGCSAAVRVMESLREEGDVFDAVLDTIGGKAIRAAGERLLRSTGLPGESRRHGVGQFTTTVGDKPERTIPSARDNLRAGLRTFRRGSGDAAANSNKSQEEESKVGYAWVQVTQDIDWEGAGIDETLATLVRLAAEDGVRPLVDDLERSSPELSRIVSMSDAPYVFVDNGRLRDGGTVVVKVAIA